MSRVFQSRLAGLLLAGMVFASFTARASAQGTQDRVEFEDERVRVERVLLPPEARLGDNSLDATIVAVKPCSLRLVVEPASAEVLTGARTHLMKAGEILVVEQGWAWLQNQGTGADGMQACELLITYLKTPSAASRKETFATEVAGSKPAQAPSLPAAKPEVRPSPPVAPVAAHEAARGDYRFLNLNNTSIAYIEKGSGEAVLFLHGSLNDYRDWSASVDELSRGFRAISYSRRYHHPNPTKDKPKDYTFEQNVADLVALMDHLHLQRAHLVGQGYGAAVATLAAATHPTRVKSLVLLDPDFEQMLEARRAYAAKYARLEIYSIVHKALSKDSPERAVQTYLDWLRGSGSYSALAIEDQARLKQNANALKAQAFAKEDNAFACDDAKKLNLPVLLLTGQPATPNKVMMMAGLADCLPQAEQMIVPGQMKSLKVSDPEFVHRAIAEFIARK